MVRPAANILGLCTAALLAAQPPAAAPQLQLTLPLERVAYQTNETIDLAVTRGGSAALPAEPLTLQLRGADGSRLEFRFPLPAVPVVGKDARATEHLHLNGRLLRPGKYTIQVSFGGATAEAPIEVYSHVRQSTFKLADWASRAQGNEQAVLGPAGMGFNVLLASYGGLSADDAIRAGLDYLWCCTMSGGHQMDLRMECDWSDPYVLGGATARVVRRAFIDRTKPNAIGVHFYDEPGLTWHKHPTTGEFTPHNLPSQDRAFKAAFGTEPLQYHQVKPDNPEHLQRWQHWGRWKMAFLEAAWRDAAFGVSQVRGDFLSANQHIYGWPAYADGYYFNIARRLPVLLGHGGYDDYGGLYFNPSYHLEFGRARDLARPTWYLPTWYGNTPADRFRMEQYLSFMTGIQGLMKPPDVQVHKPEECPAAAGVVESNKLMARLGTIFTTTMTPTRPAVAVLYSLSHNLNAQAHDMKDNYDGAKHGRTKTLLAYLAGKQAQVELFPVVEEDILDGTLAAQHKAVVLPGVNYLLPEVVAGLEAFAAAGGKVWLTDDCQVKVSGAEKLGAAADPAVFDRIAKLYEEKKEAELAQTNTVGNLRKAAEPLARALAAKCREANLPPLECDQPGVVVSRQASGDIEYLFAVNATFDPAGGDRNAIKPVVAQVKLPVQGRAVYDAVHSGPAVVAGAMAFGPGEMHAWALTARPIGGVQAHTPTVYRDYTLEADPLGVQIGATLADAKGKVLAGAAPLAVRVIDPLGVPRYDLYRAADRGVLQLRLPLAANDPAGEWKVVVRDLLAGTEDTATFSYRPAPSAPVVAGRTARAVTFGNDRENVYRFFRHNRDLTVVTGTAPYHAAAAQRLAEVFKPWNVQVKVVKAADVKPREITADEALTWCGLEPGKVKVGRDNNPVQVGYDLRGGVLVLGTPADNPLVAFLDKAKFLPYPITADFPGRGRGHLAWQRDGLAYGFESVALIAGDEAGMAGAVGTLYEAATGLDPLTRYVLPLGGQVTPATEKRPRPPEPEVAWSRALPDRLVGAKVLTDGNLVLLANAGVVTVCKPDGTAVWQKTVSSGEVWSLDATSDGKLIVVGSGPTVVGLDATGQQIFMAPPAAAAPVHTVTCVAVAPDGSRVAYGLSDGSLWITNRPSEARALVPGVTAEDKKTPPQPYLEASFAGGNLTARTAREWHTIGVADGKIAQRTPVTKAQDPQKAAYQDPLRVIKEVLPRGGKAAVIYWGGLVRIGDGAGKVTAERQFPQDVSRAVWAGDGLLVVGLAEGQVVALKVP